MGSIPKRAQHTTPPEFGGKWGTECLNTRLPLPTLLCSGYRVKRNVNINLVRYIKQNTLKYKDKHWCTGVFIDYQNNSDAQICRDFPLGFSRKPKNVGKLSLLFTNVVI